MCIQSEATLEKKLIEQLQKELAMLKEFKKGMLQGMFV